MKDTAMTRKIAIARIIIALLGGSAAAFLGVFLCRGPRLGGLYDSLMERRAAPAALPSLVLIRTSENPGLSREEGEPPLDPRELSLALRVLMEMNAASLVVQTPVPGISAGSPEDPEETLRRFEEEFSLIGENVRVLFQAIRTGSVRPGDTERYVGELLSLIDRGKERLVSGMNRRVLPGPETAGLDRVWIAGAVYPRLEERRDTPWYSRSIPDSDGRLRRIAPVLYQEGGEREHIAYAALKRQFNLHTVSRNELGLTLRGEDSGDIFVPLDARGALIFQAPEKGFTVLDSRELLEYEELDRELYRRLQEMRKAGYFDSLEPEKYPVFLYEFAQAAGEEFFTLGGGEREEAWLSLRAQYMESLAELFSGPVESSLVTGYEELIAQNEIDEQGRERLRSLRTLLIASFAETRSAYETLSALRKKLSESLSSAFCVLGQSGAFFKDGVAGADGGGANPTDSEASLILVNSILSGAAVTPAENIELFFWAFSSVVIAAFILRRKGIVTAAVLGLFLAVLAFSAFSSALIFGGRWIDPLVPGAAVFAASLFSALTALVIRNHGRRVIRRAYAPYASKPALRQVLRAGLHYPEEVRAAGALVLAVRYIPAPGAKESPLLAAERLRAYREEAGALLKKAGAALAGCDGNLILAAFGSPLGTGKQKKGEAQDPLDRALFAALEFLRGTDKAWCFGIDIGECAFSYAEIAGYSLLGPPAVSARLLSSLAPRYDVRCLASCRVRSRLERAGPMLKNAPDLKRLDVMVERESGQEEEFFSLSFPG